MKKAFTLVELLVVVVVIVTLMTITFKLAGSGGDSTARNVTVNRMQRLENCLSGYYAAYGSYPPVRLHGSRDYTCAVDENSQLQNVGQTDSGKLDYARVEAACRSQPLAFEFPYNENMKEFMDDYCNQKCAENPKLPRFQALIDNSIVSDNKIKSSSSWEGAQIFKFGVMSYLLPRYLITMGGGQKQVDQELFTEQRSWYDNNQLPSDFETGAPYPSWRNVVSEAYEHPWKIAALPSQATCSRWLPNLEGTCAWITSRPLYGVDIRDHDDYTIPARIYSPGGYGSTSQAYKLNCITVKDGWGIELYYYSPPPHQTYILWSSGANKKTFPPWVTDEERDRISDRQTLQSWVSDDIMQMSN